MLPEFANGKNNYICQGVGGRGPRAKVPTTIVVIARVVVVVGA